MQFYHSYVSDRPLVSPAVYTTCDDITIKTKKKIIRREQITRDIVERKFDDSFWLEQYIFIRHAESRLNLSKTIMNQCRRQAQLLLKNNGMSIAAQYINEKFNNLSLTTNINYDKI